MGDYKRAGLLVLCAAALRIAAEFVLPLIYQGSDLLQLYALSTLLVSIGAIYLPALAFMRKRPAPAYGRARVGARAVFWSVLLGWGLFELSTGINALFSLLFDALGAKPLGLVLPPTDGWRLFAAALLIAVVPAMTEEPFFRGALLFSWLPMGRRKAALLCAALFALMHFQPLSFPAILLVGYLLGVVTLDTRSVYPAMVVHGVNNLAAMLMSVSAQAAPDAPQASAGDMAFGIAIYLVFGAMFTIWSMRKLRAAQTPGGEGAHPAALAEGTKEKGLVLPLAIATALLLAMNAAMLAINFGWIAL